MEKYDFHKLSVDQIYGPYTSILNEYRTNVEYITEDAICALRDIQSSLKKLNKASCRLKYLSCQLNEDGNQIVSSEEDFTDPNRNEENLASRLRSCKQPTREENSSPLPETRKRDLQATPCSHCCNVSNPERQEKFKCRKSSKPDSGISIEVKRKTSCKTKPTTSVKSVCKHTVSKSEREDFDNSNSKCEIKTCDAKCEKENLYNSNSKSECKNFADSKLVGKSEGKTASKSDCKQTGSPDKSHCKVANISACKNPDCKTVAKPGPDKSECKTCCVCECKTCSKCECRISMKPVIENYRQPSSSICEESKSPEEQTKIEIKKQCPTPAVRKKRPLPVNVWQKVYETSKDEATVELETESPCNPLNETSVDDNLTLTYKGFADDSCSQITPSLPIVLCSTPVPGLDPTTRPNFSLEFIENYDYDNECKSNSEDLSATCKEQPVSDCSTHQGYSCSDFIPTNETVVTDEQKEKMDEQTCPENHTSTYNEYLSYRRYYQRANSPQCDHESEMIITETRPNFTNDRTQSLVCRHDPHSCCHSHYSCIHTDYGANYPTMTCNHESGVTYFLNDSQPSSFRSRRC